MAEATDWVSRILAVAVLMALPGVVGGYLDRRWGTGYLSVLGFIAGTVFGIAGLIVITHKMNRSRVSPTYDRSRSDAERSGFGSGGNDPQDRIG